MVEYEAWTEGGCSELWAQSRKQAIHEMDEQFPGWRTDTTVGLYEIDGETVLTYDPDLDKWVEA